MEFSVIIPAYNASGFITKCLDSVFHQNYNPEQYEVIVVDDCSSDETSEKVREYEQILRGANPRYNLTLIRHEENKRQGGARNTAIKEAKGEWIFFLDSDDYWLTHEVFKVYDSIIKEIVNFDIIESLTHLDVDDTHDRQLVRYDGNLAVTVLETAEYFRKRLRNGYIWRCCYKKTLIENIPFREKVYFEYGDWKVRVYLAANRIATFDFPFYGYYNNVNSTIRRPKIEVFYANVECNRIIANLFSSAVLSEETKIILWQKLKRNIFSWLKISKEYSVRDSVKVFKEIGKTELLDSPYLVMNFSERMRL